MSADPLTQACTSGTRPYPPMPFGRLALHALVLSMLPWTPSCERSRAEVERDSPTIRISAGVATGTFGPFSSALVEGYKQLLPDLRFELVDSPGSRSEEHTSELQSQSNLVCRLLLEKKNK